ncbi:MAG: TraB/GumN family protein [Ferruginibacter sp.]
MYNRYLVFLFLGIGLFFNASAQRKTVEKYPSLLWEITGNGLSRPSYLFGTMHVSNKLAFHLSDSFYHVLKRVDEVALELNPETWQGQMADLDKLKENYYNFVQPAGNDFITENSFRLHNYTGELTAALRNEPSVVNNLLYRSYKAKEDFEEDTFLDMYIYQTGRKLGKRPAGLENYYQAEKIVLEAYRDMAREKKKKNPENESDYTTDIFEKVQNAYRRGDLDMMDSLEMVMEKSAAFREKFLFERNVIQANSIDSIIKKSSLFAGVGAAHLPGPRGVIELLRAKGYQLRPIKMSDRDGVQKQGIDDLKVPVHFQKKQAEDKFYSVDVPGELYKVSQDYLPLDRRQYADMSNGSYYIVTRVKTHSSFLNQSLEKVMFKVDSVLYENIPGKILSKKLIEKNKYPGYDILSRTRRGDMQRYNIFVTPFEIIIFKMSGKENYVDGKEAEQFFSSISFKEEVSKPFLFVPLQGGFTIQLPHEPHQYFNNISQEDRWEYEATDKNTGNGFLVIKKSVYNFDHLDDDDFRLGLMEESFHNNELFEKQVSRKKISFLGNAALQVKEKLKDGTLIDALFIINGPHNYLLAIKNISDSNLSNDYFNSFGLVPSRYGRAENYLDTFLHAGVKTSVLPGVDEGMRKIIEQTEEDIENGNNFTGYISYWPKIRNAVFKSDSTGELISVKVQAFPKYFYITDSAKYWKSEINDPEKKKDMVVHSVRNVSSGDMAGIRILLKDTGSSQVIDRLVLLKNNYKYSITTITSSVDPDTGFAGPFFSTFHPYNVQNNRSLYESRLSQFFSELFSSDSAVQSRAQQAIQSIYYGPPGIKYIENAINRLNVLNKDYYETKRKFIAELGFIKDSTGQVVSLLKTIYRQAGDTSLFQNEVIRSLSEIKTKVAYRDLKNLLLMSPPVFENSYDLNSIFINFQDTLQLSAGLFPGILQLSTLEDYKNKVWSLLRKGVDSGFIKKGAYKKYLREILIDAKVALKKQSNREEKRRQEEIKNNETTVAVRFSDYEEENEIRLEDYGVLLFPFYKNKDVQLFFTSVLRSRDENLKLATALQMIKNNIAVPDTLLYALAANEKTRSNFYKGLLPEQRVYMFPGAFKNQLSITRSYIILENEYDKMDSLVFLSKIQTSFKGNEGYVYFYKYRIFAESDWKIAMTGLQPLDENKISTDPIISVLTEYKINETEPLTEQLNKQLKKAIIPLYKSGRNFYSDNYAPRFE